MLRSSDLARRNLTDAGRSDLRGIRYNNSKKAAHGRTDREFWGYQNDTPKTREAIAAEEGIGPATVTRDGKFSEALVKSMSFGSFGNTSEIAKTLNMILSK